MSTFGDKAPRNLFNSSIDSRMSQITSLYVHKVVGQASPEVETRDLVEGLGLSADGPIDPARMVPSTEYYDFFAALVARDPEGLILPLRIGAAMADR